MTEITITLDKDQHRRLAEEHKRMSIAWLRDKPDAPPDFAKWLGQQLDQAPSRSAPDEREIEEVRLVDALEKLITSLQQHGFALAQIDRREREAATKGLAHALASQLGLSPQRTKRVQELLAYYTKGAREVADAAHIGITNRAYGALHEAQRALIERSTAAAAHLGPDRAHGRVEGAVAILVMLDVLSRQNARETTDAFKRQLQQ